MKIVIFTSNAVRHKYLANTLAKSAGQALIVPECRQCDADTGLSTMPPAIGGHFQMRAKIEAEFFPGNDSFLYQTLPILYQEINNRYVFEVVRKFAPEAMFVFGASIIKEPLLSLLPKGRFINLHLGLSPYYRGSGTNFWPLVNNEPGLVGSTILSIDSGIDTGDIICHVRPKIEPQDDVHRLGCKVIRDSAECLIKIISLLKQGKKLISVKQWKIPNQRYYRNCDFNEETLLKYKNNLSAGMLQKYLQGNQDEPELIKLGAS